MLKMTILLGMLVALSGCAAQYQSIFPSDIESQIDATLSFAELKESPTTHVGKVIVLAGEVLSATRLADRTRITMLQLPTLETQEPTTERIRSQGRFMAFQKDFLDPATVPSGSRVTIVGEVTGANRELLDEMPYTYPTVAIKHLKVWPDTMQPPYGYGRYARPYYGYPYGYVGPYWRGYGRFYGPYFRPFGYRYWW